LFFDSKDTYSRLRIEKRVPFRKVIFTTQLLLFAFKRQAIFAFSATIEHIQINPMTKLSKNIPQLIHKPLKMNRQSYYQSLTQPTATVLLFPSIKKKRGSLIFEAASS
jgi:hypothetical protein